MFRSKEGWITEYQRRGAYWKHDGNPKRPHALLTSGNHSNGFINNRIVIADELLLHAAASDLVELFVERNKDILGINGIDCVVGPQAGATKLAELMSNVIGKMRGRPCRWASPAKHSEGEARSMIFNDPQHMVQKGDICLVCEDVVTTGGSINLTIQAIIEAKGFVLPYIMALANRSGLKSVDRRDVIALIESHMPMWAPDKCPLCARGSEALRPKDNWELLNQNYS